MLEFYLQYLLYTDLDVVTGTSTLKIFYLFFHKYLYVYIFCIC